MGILLPMGLVCLFAFCSLALALVGGQAYKHIQGNVDDSFGSTVAASYLRTKLCQPGGQVSLRTEDGVQVLAIAQTSAGTTYETRIYFSNGQLLEAFVAKDTPFYEAGGMQIAQLAGCEFALSSDGLFEAELTSDAGTLTRTACAVQEGGTS